MSFYPNRNPNYSGIGKTFQIFSQNGRKKTLQRKKSSKKYAKTTFGKYGNWLNLSQSPNKFNKKSFTGKRHKIFPSIQKMIAIQDIEFFVFYFSFEIEHFELKKILCIYYDVQLRIYATSIEALTLRKRFQYFLYSNRTLAELFMKIC